MFQIYILITRRLNICSSHLNRGFIFSYNISINYNSVSSAGVDIKFHLIRLLSFVVI